MPTALIHIVINKRQDYSLADFTNSTWDKGEELCSRYSWTWAVYRMLKHAGFEISVGHSYQKDAINLIHYYGVRANGLKPHRFFTVYLRADYRDMPFAQLRIVQNKTQVHAGCLWIKHHPQPCLKPRDPARREVSNIAFFGSPANSVKLSESALQRLHTEGLRLNYNTEFSDRGDYSNVDIAIGVREFSTKRFDHKPATKMTNAWLASIPFIGGFDSAFEQNGSPGHDYIRVSQEAELVHQLITLKRDPSVYASYIANTRAKAKEYTFEACSEAWKNLMEVQIIPIYQSWNKRSSLKQMLAYGNYAAYYLKEMILVKTYHKAKSLISRKKPISVTA